MENADTGKGETDDAEGGGNGSRSTALEKAESSCSQNKNGGVASESSRDHSLMERGRRPRVGAPVHVGW